MAGLIPRLRNSMLKKNAVYKPVKKAPPPKKKKPTATKTTMKKK